jgi:hypothetical protein
VQLITSANEQSMVAPVEWSANTSTIGSRGQTCVGNNGTLSTDSAHLTAVRQRPHYRLVRGMDSLDAAIMPRREFTLRQKEVIEVRRMLTGLVKHVRETDR